MEWHLGSRATHTIFQDSWLCTRQAFRPSSCSSPISSTTGRARGRSPSKLTMLFRLRFSQSCEVRRGSEQRTATEDVVVEQHVAIHAGSWNRTIPDFVDRAAGCKDEDGCYPQ